ncbi:hypothetical protein V6N13_075193 [Hibiscus sabdariffa]
MEVIREYVKDFSEVLSEISNYPSKETFYAFYDGLQNLVKLEIERRGVQDLASTITIVESLAEFKKSENSTQKDNKGHDGGGSKLHKEGSPKPTYKE